MVFVLPYIIVKSSR